MTITISGEAIQLTAAVLIFLAALMGFPWEKIGLLLKKFSKKISGDLWGEIYSPWTTIEGALTENERAEICLIASKVANFHKLVPILTSYDEPGRSDNYSEGVTHLWVAKDERLSNFSITEREKNGQPEVHYYVLYLYNKHGGWHSIFKWSADPSILGGGGELGNALLLASHHDCVEAFLSLYNQKFGKQVKFSR